MASSYKYLIGIFFVPFFQKFINYQMSWKIKLLDPQKWWTHRLVPMSHAKNILLLFLHNAPISAGSGISDLGFGFLNCHGELGFSFFIFCQSFLSYICKITNIGDFFFVEIILWIFEKFPNKNLYSKNPKPRSQLSDLSLEPAVFFHNCLKYP